MQSDLAADQTPDKDGTILVSGTVLKPVHDPCPFFLSSKLEDPPQALSSNPRVLYVPV